MHDLSTIVSRNEAEAARQVAVAKGEVADNGPLAPVTCDMEDALRQSAELAELPAPRRRRSRQAAPLLVRIKRQVLAAFGVTPKRFRRRVRRAGVL